MNRSLFRITAYLQLGITILLSAGCAPTQPFFFHESPDLQHYLNTATAIEYPDVEVESLAETTESMRPLSIGNHDYQFWDLTLEECVSIALQNAKFFVTTNGNAEFRQNIAAQFTSGTADQFGSIYDVAIQQSTTQSVPLTVDGNGNRVLPRGVLRANQVGGVEDALAEFDAQTSSFINYSTTDRLRNSQIADPSNPTFFSTATDTTQQSAISKRIATGGVVTLRQQIIYARNNAATGGAIRALPSDWTALIEAQVQHPLMRNRGTLINRIPVVLASLNEDLSIADFEIQVRNLVRDVENAYWDLYVGYRNVSTAVIGRNSAMATAQFARLNLDQGTGTRQALAQAVGQYYQFRGLLESALAGSNLAGGDRFGVYGRERVMRELLGLAATDGRLIRPTQEPTIARVEFDWNESVAQMLYLSPELRRNKTRIKQSELELVSAKNQILPDVNLSLLYRWVGVGDRLGAFERSGPPFPAPGSTALGEMAGGDYQEGAIRLEVTPPAIGARRELARIRGAQWRLVREKGFLQEQERLLVSQLSDAVAKTVTHFQLVQTNALFWQAEEVEVGARMAEFKGGGTPINVLLDSQQRRAEAQIAYYRALAEYNKSLNYVDYLRGTMLANSNITLAEGPWNKKAYWDALERARERSAGKELQYGVSRPGVVRRGPLKDADAAMSIIGSGAATFGETLPPGGVSGLGLGQTEGFGGPDGLNMQPHRGPIDLNETPLTEMDSLSEMMSSDSTIELIAPQIDPRAIEQGAVVPRPFEAREFDSPAPRSGNVGSGNVGSGNVGSGNVGSGNVMPMIPTEDPGPDPRVNTSILRQLSVPDSGQVSPMSHQSEVDVSFSPEPVRRKPVPSGP